MEWLRETMELSNFVYQSKTMKTENAAVEVTTKTRHLGCYIYGV